MDSRDLFIAHNSFTTVKWKVISFDSVNLSAPSVTSNNLLVAGDVAPLDTFYPDFLIDSFI